MSFKELFLQAVKQTNEAFSEEGRYVSYVVFPMIDQSTGWEEAVIAKIDLTDGTKIEAYKFRFGALEVPYMVAYRKDGGNEEYESVANWMVNWRSIMRVGVPAQVHV